MADEILKDEQLNDDELDNVAGGGTMQTLGDQDFLSMLGYTTKTGFTDPFIAAFKWEKISSAVDAGWAKAGVTCVTKFGCPDNLYFINGQQVSRKEAFAHALRQQGASDDVIANYDYNMWRGSL